MKIKKNVDQKKKEEKKVAIIRNELHQNTWKSCCRIRKCLILKFCVIIFYDLRNGQQSQQYVLDVSRSGFWTRANKKIQSNCMS